MVLQMAPALPFEIWKLILSQLDQRSRLGSCSLVSTLLNRAAAAATDSVSRNLCHYRDPERTQKLQEWIVKYGSALSSLEVSHSPIQFVELPCSKLLQLNFSGMDIQLGVSSSHAGVLQGPTSLTNLTLAGCTLQDGPRSLNALTVLTCMQHLQLSTLSTQPQADGMLPAQGFQDTLYLPAAVLQQLSRLTHLTLSGDNIKVNKASLQHISALRDLQELSISNSNLALSRTNSPGLLKLTALRKLHLQGVALKPIVLSNCTKLQELCLHAVKLMLIFGGDQPDIQGGTLLLQALRGLTKLQIMKLSDISAGWPAVPAADYRQPFHIVPCEYMHLAPSALQHLELQRCDLPARVWPHVFCGGQLESLHSCIVSWRPDDDWCATTSEQPLTTPAAAMSRWDVYELARACPNLRTLHLHAQGGANYGCLNQLGKLKNLETLTVDGVEKPALGNLEDFSRLSALRHMELVVTAPICHQDLLGLTMLTGLNDLRVDINPGLNFPTKSEVDCLYESYDPVSDVWLQLLAHAADDSSCTSMVVDCLGEKVLSLKRDNILLQEQLAKQQQDMLTLRAQQQQHQRTHQLQLAELQAHAAAQQQQMAAQEKQLDDAHTAAVTATSEAAALSARVHALEGQLQQLLQTLQR